MKNDTHDNDNLNPWSSIGWQAALILNQLRCRAQLQLLELTAEQKEGGKENPQSENETKERPEQNRADVAQSLHELAALKEKGGII